MNNDKVAASVTVLDRLFHKTVPCKFYTQQLEKERFSVLMCIMDNDNDPPARTLSWRFSDEKHKINK